MQTLRQIVDGNSIYAYGTSEGVKRAWDTRGRRDEEKTTNRNREIARFNPNQTSIFGPQHVQELQKIQRMRQIEEKEKAEQKARIQRDSAYQSGLQNRSGVGTLDAGEVEQELEQEENGAGGPAH